MIRLGKLGNAMAVSLLLALPSCREKSPPATRPDADLTLPQATLDDNWVLLYSARAQQDGQIHHGRVNDDFIRMATSIEACQTLPDGRLFVQLHVNPSLEVGVAIDPLSGNHHSYAGENFTFSPTCEHVAYLREPPHFGSPADAPSTLCIDDIDQEEVAHGAKVRLRWISPTQADADVQLLDGSARDISLDVTD